MSDGAVIEDKAEAAEIRVFGRVLVILGAFVPENRWLSNSELAKLTGFSRSTVVRLTTRLSRTGYLEQSTQAPRFRLGLNVRRFGCYALSASDLIVLARYCFEDVVETAKTSLCVYRHEGDSMALLEVVTPRNSVVAVPPMDKILPVSTSDAGIAVLANLPDDVAGSIFTAGDEGGSEHSAKALSQVAEAREQIKQKRFYAATGRAHPTMNTVTTVLGVYERSECYAFQLSGPDREFTVDRLNFEFGPLLATGTRKLAGELGLGDWFTDEVAAHQ